MSAGQLANTRWFEFSSNTFGGFRVQIDVITANTTANVIDIAKNYLLSVLTAFDFEILVKQARNTDFHIHDVSLDDMKFSDQKRVFYICDHV